ncbi:MAG: OmpA family protein, partial [Nitratireductor sp.]
VEAAAEGADPRAGIRHDDFEDDPFAPTVEQKPDETDRAGAQAEAAGEDDRDGKAEAEKPDAAALAEAEAISEELARAFGTGEKIYDGISVTPTERGVMVSLTDQLDYGMYEIGSAVPRRDLVLAMEKVATVLGSHKGAITINGHTDGRPFRSKDYDNWRLSTARAHSAYYMLVRGGLDEQRIREVTGYADRQLKVPDNPLDDRNRRIEIVLETKG